MADVENTAVTVNLATDVSHIQKNIEVINPPKVETEIIEKSSIVSIVTGPSPTQERSSNSHQHDSEYDTASDLEGVEDYAEEEQEEEDDSATDEEDYDESDENDIHAEGDEDCSTTERTDDGSTPKKVDEDRTNPQYIPKRGTFYEHDDREDEIAADAKGVKASPTPTAQAPKPKKWQQANNTDRWSHDRFDASEQAPKSRTELVTAYGYDIRKEEAPPRARRRRHYTKGPTRYHRNWEDENAYLRMGVKERRIPRPSDFPALNEQVQKTRKSVNSRLQRGGRGEEHEWRQEERSIENERPERSGGRGGGNSQKMNKFGGNNSRSNANTGRQVPMEFKNKNRRNQNETNNRNTLEATQHERKPSHQQQSQQSNVMNAGGMTNEMPKYGNNLAQTQTKTQQNFVNDNNYNNNSNNNVMRDKMYHMQTTVPTAVSQQQQQQQIMRQNQPPPHPLPTTSNLQQRLQQVQNRNDPSHVGSVQMHTLATQNQMQVSPQQQQQQQAAGGMLMQQPPPPPPPAATQAQQQMAQEQQQQRGPPKRYSSIRRTQHDQHLSDHQLQQLQQQQQQQQQAMMMPPDQQHLLAQANLMQQFYHQENLQAQMQALQVNPAAQPATVATKPNNYGTVPGAPAPTAQGYAPNSAGSANVPPSAYYVATGQPPDGTSYAQQTAPPTNYLPPAPYGSGPAPVGQPSAAYPAVSVAAAAVAAGQPTNSANPNFTSYQNYNTIGGTTYFVPPAQPTARPVALPQRRPTNAIPILPPDNSERNKQLQQQRVTSEIKEEISGGAIDSAENIDHILDNMFVQRPVFQPPRKSSSPPAGEQVDVTPIATPTPIQAATEDLTSNVAGVVNVEKTADLNVNATIEQQETVAVENPTAEKE